MKKQLYISKRMWMTIMCAIISLAPAAGAQTNDSSSSLCNANDFKVFMELNPTLKEVADRDLTTLTDSCPQYRSLYELFHLILTSRGEWYRVRDSIESQVVVHEFSAHRVTKFCGTYYGLVTDDTIPDVSPSKYWSDTIRIGTTPHVRDVNLLVDALNFIGQEWRYTNFTIHVVYGREDDIPIVKEVAVSAGY